jgi:hypothetical protein
MIYKICVNPFNQWQKKFVPIGEIRGKMIKKVTKTRNLNNLFFILERVTRPNSNIALIKFECHPERSRRMRMKSHNLKTRSPASAQFNTIFVFSQ